MNKLIAILNCDAKYGIGKRNGLLFHQPLDMKFFRETTRGHVVAMGENTLISFPGSQPLKNRTNIVLSQDVTHNYDGVINVHSMEEFKAAIKKELEANDVYIIGGASIYKQMLPFYNEVLLTKIDADGGAEVFHQNLDELENWKLVEKGEPIDDNGYTIRFCTYKNDDVKTY